MRLIDADALLEAMNNARKFGNIHKDIKEEFKDMPEVLLRNSLTSNEIIALINYAPTVPCEGWISVEDNPPERIEGMKILCYGNGYIFECEYEDGYWINIGGEDFTHWQPLPAAPTDKD